MQYLSIIASIFLAACASTPDITLDQCFDRPLSTSDEKAEAREICRSRPVHATAEELESRANVARAVGRYNDAFLLYLTACGDALSDSCFRAAELWDRGIVDGLPPELVVYLYQTACEAGHTRACQHPSQREPN